MSVPVFVVLLLRFRLWRLHSFASSSSSSSGRQHRVVPGCGHVSESHFPGPKLVPPFCWHFSSVRTLHSFSSSSSSGTQQRTVSVGGTAPAQGLSAQEPGPILVPPLFVQRSGVRCLHSISSPSSSSSGRQHRIVPGCGHVSESHFPGPKLVPPFCWHFSGVRTLHSFSSSSSSGTQQRTVFASSLSWCSGSRPTSPLILSS